MNTCPYCTETAPDGEACYQPHGDLVCTRAPGHNGPHVACGDEHQIETWGGSGSLTDRARARAEELWTRELTPGHLLSGPERMNRRIGFEVGAQWAASQPVTDAEVEAVARELDPFAWPAVTRNDENRQQDARILARAALTAAREAQR